ncbi:hypothetical protein SprV_0602130400 [Sparganum proliferum]
MSPGGLLSLRQTEEGVRQDEAVFCAGSELERRRGDSSLSLNIGLRRLFPWVFVVADIPCAILGADSLAAFDLLVDCSQSCLHGKTTNLTVRRIPSSYASRQFAVLNPEPENPFRQLLSKYPSLTRPNSSASIPRHDVVHHIRTTVPPVFSRPGLLALS